MHLQSLRDFFMWCTILSGALYLITAFFVIYTRDWVYRINARRFSISRDAFNIAIFAYVGLFKLLFLLFILIPYIALLIIT